MSYHLGIDLGTTYTAAAIERDGLVEALTLGNRSASVPSVVFLRDDGEILVGEAATRRAMSEPGRVGREFKRRVGDPTPIILGGTPYAAEMLMARVLRWSVDRVQEQQGGPPRAIALTHPANWGPYKLDLLAQAVRQVDVDVVMTLPEPVAAATFYASQRRLDPGAVVAVYDLGGGTFDAAMVRRKADGFEVIGTPEGIERLGGIDFDEAVYAHVRAALGDALDVLDPDEPAAVAAMARLRQECIDAKEALSSDTDVSIPVLLPNLQTEVRLTRSEFEGMIRPAINETIVALRRSVRSASVSNEQISAVLLVGGSSRIPLVAQMVAAELGRPIAIDAHPKDAISFGAAIAVAQRQGEATPETVTTVLPDERPPPPTMATGTGRPAPPATPTVARPAPPTGVGPAAGRPVAPAGARPAPPVTPAASGVGQAGGVPAGQHAGPPGGHTVRPEAPVQPGAQRPATYGQQGAYSGTAGPTTAGPATAGPTTAGSGGHVQGQPAAHAGPAAGNGPMGQVAQGASPMGGMPSAPGPGQGQAPGGHAYGAPGYTSGGYPAQGRTSSGGYPAQHGGYQASKATDDRTMLLIAIGVAAVALFIVLAALIARRNDEGAQSYTDEVKRNFVSGCTSGQSAPSEAVCECTFEKIAASVPFDDFKSFSEERDADSSVEPPTWLNSAHESCVAGEPSVSS